LLSYAATAGYAPSGAKAEPWRNGLWVVLSAGLLYGLLHATLRLSLSANLPQDDVTANILAQTLEPGYLPRQPPLYEWLLWTVQRVTGPTLPSFLFIKYGLLTATFGFLYLIGLRFFTERNWAILAALSPLLLYQTGWNLHEGVTHTMVLTCAVAASFWAFMRVVERGRVPDYILFGVFVGLGMISKWSFAAFVMALVGSCMLQHRLRQTIFNWRILLSGAASVIVASPAIYWVVAGHQDLISVYGQAVAPQASENRVKATLIGLGLSLFAPLAFLFPLDVILLALFPRAARQAAISIRNAFSPQPAGEVNWERLVLHMTIAGFVLLMLGALLTGATHYLERYMHPFFLLTALWLVGLVESSGDASRRLAALSAVLLAITLIVVPIRLSDALHAMDSDCRKCRIAIPYDGLAAKLAAQGFESGTLIATDRHDAGNLRRYFPDARIVRVERPAYAPPLRAGDGTAKVAVVWRHGSGKQVPKEARREFEQIAGSGIGTPQRIAVPGLPVPPGSAERVWEWTILVADPNR
jgi:4-amino-4-deoxy-L-arabinose transferase-like glycosyltransferase